MRLLDSLSSARALLVGLDVEEPLRQQALLPNADYLFLNSNDLEAGKEEMTELLGGGGVVFVRPDGYVGFAALHQIWMDLRSLRGSRAAHLWDLQENPRKKERPPTLAEISN